MALDTPHRPYGLYWHRHNGLWTGVLLRPAPLCPCQPAFGVPAAANSPLF